MFNVPFGEAGHGTPKGMRGFDPEYTRRYARALDAVGCVGPGNSLFNGQPTNVGSMRPLALADCAPVLNPDTTSEAVFA
jgi:hypothetical protein